jgi:hypothetical protein
VFLAPPRLSLLVKMNDRFLHQPRVDNQLYQAAIIDVAAFLVIIFEYHGWNPCNSSRAQTYFEPPRLVSSLEDLPILRLLMTPAIHQIVPRRGRRPSPRRSSNYPRRGHLRNLGRFSWARWGWTISGPLRGSWRLPKSFLEGQQAFRCVISSTSRKPTHGNVQVSLAPVTCASGPYQA